MESSCKFCREGYKEEKQHNCQYVTVNMEINNLNNEKEIEDACKIKNKLLPSLIRTIKSRVRDYSDEKEVYEAMQIIDREY